MAKRPTWYLNATRRTVLALLGSAVRPDDDWAAERLPAAEYRLFLRLSPPERAHAIEVARRALDSCPGASATLVRAALLHDVGKLGTPGGAFLRIVTHLLPPSRVPAEPRLAGLAGARQARAHHAEYGAALVLAASGDAAVARLVGLHHEPGSDREARLLHDSDALT